MPPQTAQGYNPDVMFVEPGSADEIVDFHVDNGCGILFLNQPDHLEIKAVVTDDCCGTA